MILYTYIRIYNITIILPFRAQEVLRLRFASSRLVRFIFDASKIHIVWGLDYNLTGFDNNLTIYMLRTTLNFKKEKP